MVSWLWMIAHVSERCILSYTSSTSAALMVQFQYILNVGILLPKSVGRQFPIA